MLHHLSLIERTRVGAFHVTNQGDRNGPVHRAALNLVVNLLDAADHLENLSFGQVRRLLSETAAVLGDLQSRGIPVGPRTGANQRKRNPLSQDERSSVSVAGRTSCPFPERSPGRQPSLRLAPAGRHPIASIRFSAGEATRPSLPVEAMHYASSRSKFRL